MFLINAIYLDEFFRFAKGDIEIDESTNTIKGLGEKLVYSAEDMVVDCSGYRIIPGFVDVHIHGCVGYDTCDGNREAIEKMAEFLITKGVKSFCPTTMTAPAEILAASLTAAKSCAENPPAGARVIGVNMEGPFISEARKGAQKADFIRKPDFALFKELYDISGGLVRLVDIAPEQDGGLEFARLASEYCAVSVAHTSADYDAAKAGFDAGINHATHLFNAMSGLFHREPGVVGAVFDDDRVYAELICDGHHIHPAVLRTAFRVLGDRALVISDSMRANGLPEGEEYDLGGQMVTVKNGKATLPDGTLAGSVSNLHDEVKNLVNFGIPTEKAIKAATLIPARSIGMDAEIGSIEVGKRADVLVVDNALDIKAVYH